MLKWATTWCLASRSVFVVDEPPVPGVAVLRRDDLQSAADRLRLVGSHSMCVHNTKCCSHENPRQPADRGCYQSPGAGPISRMAPAGALLSVDNCFRSAALQQR